MCSIILSRMFEDGELTKTCFGRYLDGLGWVLGPGKGLEGRKIGHDIILCRLLKIRQLRDKIGDVSHDSPLKVTANAENQQKERECFHGISMVWGPKGWDGLFLGVKWLFFTNAANFVSV